MILYGRNLSPYTRRVVMWLILQGRAFEQRPLALTVAEDRETLSKISPVARVPALVVDDGAVLTESLMICDWLDDSAPEKRLVPATGSARRDCLMRLAVLSATTDKGVALFYEAGRRPEDLRWSDWIEHLTGQVTRGLAQLETMAPEQGFWGGAGPDGSDLAAACLMDFLPMTSPHLVEGEPYPRLAGLSARVNALPGIAATKP
ncbi:MAG: glutathione S-transferase family protein [Pseudomonadota bacterium]